MAPLRFPSGEYGFADLACSLGAALLLYGMSPLALAAVFLRMVPRFASNAQETWRNHLFLFVRPTSSFHCRLHLSFLKRSK